MNTTIGTFSPNNYTGIRAQIAIVPSNLPICAKYRILHLCALVSTKTFSIFKGCEIPPFYESPTSQNSHYSLLINQPYRFHTFFASLRPCVFS